MLYTLLASFVDTQMFVRYGGQIAIGVSTQKAAVIALVRWRKDKPGVWQEMRPGPT